jgi:energy-coupling factor transport system ATP-binding protein
VRVTDASLERPGWRLSVPSLELAPGTLIVLGGATGAGKSTVLDAFSGVFQHLDGGRQRGVVAVGGIDRAAVPPRETAGFVGVVAQRVRPAFVGETVAEELGFALALRGVAPVIVAARVREVARRLGVEPLLTRPIDALSAGEAELVAIGAAISERPTLLLVDEPLAELDALARPRVVAALGALAHEAGICVVVAEHRIAWFSGVADRWLSIAGGELRETDAPAAAARVGLPAAAVPRPSTREERANGDPRAVVAELRHVTVRHAGRTVVDGVSLELASGELVALTGPNGAGKSSLLTEFALPSEPGRILVGGDDVHALRPRARRAAVALVPEAVDDLFVTDSVRAECGRSGAATLECFGTLLGIDPHSVQARELAETHPRDLSGGQRVCLAIAVQLAADPRVLLVDEPVRGLDAAAQKQVAAALSRAAACGTAVLFATHEHDFAVPLAHRIIRLEDGRVAPREAVIA